MSQSKSIGILYICTGKYIAFWESFHESFEKYFLPDTIKNYYILTDKPENITQSERVKAYYIDPMPWPLITLLRFHYFTRFKDEIINNDYLMFANSNFVCREVIQEEEFLPNDNQELSCVIHPGFYNRKARWCPYERNRKSRAYVPYNIEGKYVMGSLICGHSDKFMKMSEILASRINEDFNNRVIALWHDESQFNRYVLENSNSKRYLSPSFAYPEGWDLPFDDKLELLDKSKFFSVYTFKGYTKPELSLIEKIINLPAKIFHQLITSRYMRNILCLRDSLLMRKL
ncbi:MAG: hypothetical protein IJP48_00175 [Synergistaceae bacterium]|nr:hypothetical protein [Synergistaceae bacterium]